MPFDFAALALGLGAVLRFEGRAGARLPPGRATSAPDARRAAKPRDVLPLARSRDAVTVEPLVARRAPLATPLSPVAAARRFVRWMQEMGFAGERPWAGPDGVWEMYLWHCHDERLTPVADNMLGDALGELARERRPVVSKRLVRLRGVDGTGKRVLHRPTYYTFSEPAPEAKPKRRAKGRR